MWPYLFLYKTTFLIFFSSLILLVSESFFPQEDVCIHYIEQLNFLLAIERPQEV